MGEPTTQTPPHPKVLRVVSPCHPHTTLIQCRAEGWGWQSKAKGQRRKHKGLGGSSMKQGQVRTRFLEPCTAKGGIC